MSGGTLVGAGGTGASVRLARAGRNVPRPPAPTVGRPHIAATPLTVASPVGGVGSQSGSSCGGRGFLGPRFPPWACRAATPLMVTSAFGSHMEGMWRLCEDCGRGRKRAVPVPTTRLDLRRYQARALSLGDAQKMTSRYVRAAAAVKTPPSRWSGRLAARRVSRRVARKPHAEGTAEAHRTVDRDLAAMGLRE